MHLVRDPGTGKSKGFAFVAYEDQRSTTLAVDNFNGAKILGRTIRVDHKTGYKPPQRKDDEPVNEAVEEAKRRALSLNPIGVSAHVRPGRGGRGAAEADGGGGRPSPRPPRMADKAA